MNSCSHSQLNKLPIWHTFILLYRRGRCQSIWLEDMKCPLCLTHLLNTTIRAEVVPWTRNTLALVCRVKVQLRLRRRTVQFISYHSVSRRYIFRANGNGVPMGWHSRPLLTGRKAFLFCWTKGWRWNSSGVPLNLARWFNRISTRLFTTRLLMAAYYSTRIYQGWGLLYGIPIMLYAVLMPLFEGIKNKRNWFFVKSPVPNTWLTQE